MSSSTPTGITGITGMIFTAICVAKLEQSRSTYCYTESGQNSPGDPGHPGAARRRLVGRLCLPVALSKQRTHSIQRFRRPNSALLSCGTYLHREAVARARLCVPTVLTPGSGAGCLCGPGASDRSRRNAPATALGVPKVTWKTGTSR
jgi:hypothetical protein